MRTPRWLAVFVFVIAINGVDAGRQLAMLVEVSPRDVVEGGTLTEIVVRVAPEDRSALGEDVMLWVELTREETRILRKGWALKIDDPTQPITGEIVIPDGLHVLRVDLKGSGGRSTGVWWGDVDVSNPDPVPEDSDSQQRQRSATATVAATGTAAASAAESVPESVGGAFMPRDPDSEDVRVVNDPPTGPGEPDPVLEDSDSDQQPQPEAEAGWGNGALSEDPTMVTTDCGMPIVMEVEDPGPPYGTLTAYVTLDDRPVTGLGVEDFQIRIGGDYVDIRSLEMPGDGVTILGVAVDLQQESAADASWIGSAVRMLADRVFGAPGMVMPMYDGDSRHDWVHPDEVPAKIRPADEELSQWDNLASFVVYSLNRVRHLKGRPFLMVVTDGRGAKPNSGWMEAHRHAAEAGVPILVAGLWHDEFGSGLRKNLRKLASVSGGSVFLIQGSSQADELIRRFGSILDGSYSLGLFAEPGVGNASLDLVGTEGRVASAGTVRYGHWGPPSPQNRHHRGLFTYMADAAIFKICTTGRTFPVAMQGDYLSAERAYLEARSEPGVPLLMTFEGRVKLPPPVEREGIPISLIIDRFIAVHPGEDCGSN